MSTELGDMTVCLCYINCNFDYTYQEKNALQGHGLLNGKRIDVINEIYEV